MSAPKPNRAPRRRGYHHGDLRAVLLAAGEAELAEQGVEGFSLRGVAKRAEVSHAAPAHHFRDANGLLTALAAEGFRRFVDKQKARQQVADEDALSQLVAAGMGYVDFAMAHPALFRLMFSSNRPDHEAEELQIAASAAYRKLVEDVARLRGSPPGQSEPLPTDVMRTWAIAHGLADLMNSRRLKPLLGLRKAERDAALAAMLRRSLG
ncbi:MAG TPA: TetR/AcrR family transcriptional regulator [Dongiaceae bacterium]|nr:TetR/AcrR family transcriptional regulator [Dongiaceae bacterium]